MDVPIKPVTAGTQPAEEFDYAAVTNVAIEALEGFIRFTPKVDVVLLNIFTFLRNRTRKEATAAQIQQEALNDLHHLLQTVAEAMTLPNAHIVVYSADYSRVAPKELQRGAIPSKKNYYAACGAIRSEMSSALPKPVQVGTVTIEWLRIPVTPTPFMELVTKVRSLRCTHRVAMISHIPTDFHVCRYVPFFVLVHSFTGNLVSTEMLGDKVFGHEHLPFTKHTHALFGDKETFSSSLTIPQRREIKELAEKDRWIYKTPEYVREQLIKRGYLVSGKSYPIVGRV